MIVGRQAETLRSQFFACIQKTLRRLGKDERTGGPEVRRSGCTSHHTLNPDQGLERGKRGGEVKSASVICINGH